MTAGADSKVFRFFNQISGVSVRTKILGIILALTVSLGLWVTVQVRTQMTTTLLAELDNRGNSVASDLAGRSTEYVRENDITGLERLLTQTLANHPDTRYAFVMGPDGRVIAHTFGANVPEEVVALIPAGARFAPSHVHYDTHEGQMHDFAMPILDGTVGYVRLGMVESRLLGIIDGVTMRMLLATAVVALAGILAAIALTWLITRPIKDLVETAERLGQGDLSVRAPHWTDDEIGALADAFNLSIEELRISQAAIEQKEAARTHLLSRLINAQEDERKRIARDLHDDVGQALTSILVGLKVMGQSVESKALEEQIEELRAVSGQTLETVRLLSRELRPSALDDLGLAAALERYMQEFEQRFPNLKVDLHCNLPDRLPAGVETSLYRILQEAMNNAARHSRGDSVSVLVTRRGAVVQAIVEDNGCGFDVDAVRRSGRSVGLHSMTERAELLGGKLNIESGENGSSLYVEIPVEV